MFTIACSPGDWWYILFESPDGAERFLPVKRKFFGKWNVNNCPKCDVGHKSNVYRIPDPGDKTPEEVLVEFEQKYSTPEKYLKELNNKK